MRLRRRPSESTRPQVTGPSRQTRPHRRRRTPSFDRPYARTASPPTLAGRNVPTNVLTKNTRITIRADGRPPARSSGASSVHQRYAISTRSMTTRTHASRMNRQSAPRADCHTACGSLCHNSRAVRPAAMIARSGAREAARPGHGRGILLSRACSRLHRRHLHRNCSRDHRRPLGAGVHSALSCSRPFRAGLSDARCSAGIRQPGWPALCSGTR